MHDAPCCDRPSLTWKQSRVGDRYADLHVCTACTHIHQMESWFVPLRESGGDSCVNCGGTYVRGRKIALCDSCGLTPERSRELHDSLAAIDPERDHLQAAIAAVEAGRHVLALKLASAALQWSGADPVLARTVRLQSLVSIGQLDRALDEAWNWARTGGAPDVVWTIIADLEADAGNPEGALAALEQGLAQAPHHTGMWTDLAELKQHYDDRPVALEAARRGIVDPEQHERCVAVIASVAERYLEEGKVSDAVLALAAAEEFQERDPALAWLHARICAIEERFEPTVRWLEAVLRLEPNHAEARAALDKMRPKKRGWLW